MRVLFGRGSVFLAPITRRAFRSSLPASISDQQPQQHLSNPAHSPIPRPSRLERKQAKPKPFHPYSARIGSYEEDVLKIEPGQPEEVREIMKKLWLDPFARLVAGPTSLCCATGTHFPTSMIIDLRVALDNPSDKYLTPSVESHPPIERRTKQDISPEGSTKPRERLWLVPDKILHPDYTASNPIVEDVDLKEPVPPGMVCSELTASRYLSGIRHSKRTLLVDLPHSLPPLPIIPRSPDSTETLSLSQEVNEPTEEATPDETSPDDALINDPSSNTANTTSFSASPIQVSADLLDQITHQLALRIQQELEILCAHVQACPSLAGRRVLRPVDDHERDSMRDGDWLDPAFIPNANEQGVFGERVIAVLDLGIRKGEEEPGGFLRSVIPPRPTVDRTPHKWDKRPRQKKSPVVSTLTGRTGKNVVPPRSPRVLSPLIKSLQPPLPTQSLSSSGGETDDYRTNPGRPLEKSTLSPKDVPVYPLDLLFPDPQDQAHLSSRLEHLVHLSTVGKLPCSASAGMKPPRPLVPSVEPKTYALLLHPSLLGPYGVDTFPLFRALWRLRLWRDDCAGWDDDSREKLWESLAGSLESAEERKARKEKEEAEAFKIKMNKQFGLNL
ncbi:hypothetical protein [Phaffia rhodozyma]|uniref:Uncharacterized protein n=1 Tax=Phaffia rhodozyma TaxID=264483 RepID=A0A0F7SV69_PHARH|nr:hypothetical protein [Phaffia rhodozyma]